MTSLELRLSGYACARRRQDLAALGPAGVILTPAPRRYRWAYAAAHVRWWIRQNGHEHWLLAYSNALMEHNISGSEPSGHDGRRSKALHGVQCGHLGLWAACARRSETGRGETTWSRSSQS